MDSKDTRITIHYRTGPVLDYLQHAKKTSLIALYNADVVFAVKGACKVSTYDLTLNTGCYSDSYDYAILDQILAYDLYLSFKYKLGFKWLDYKVLGVQHAIEDLFILDVVFYFGGECGN